MNNDGRRWATTMKKYGEVGVRVLVGLGGLVEWGRAGGDVQLPPNNSSCLPTSLPGT